MYIIKKEVTYMYETISIISIKLGICATLSFAKLKKIQEESGE